MTMVQVRNEFMGDKRMQDVPRATADEIDEFLAECRADREGGERRD